MRDHGTKRKPDIGSDPCIVGQFSPRYYRNSHKHEILLGLNIVCNKQFLLPSTSKTRLWFSGKIDPCHRLS